MRFGQPVTQHFAGCLNLSLYCRVFFAFNDIFKYGLSFLFLFFTACMCADVVISPAAAVHSGGVVCVGASLARAPPRAAGYRAKRFYRRVTEQSGFFFLTTKGERYSRLVCGRKK